MHICTGYGLVIRTEAEHALGFADTPVWAAGCMPAPLSTAYWTSATRVRMTNNCEIGLAEQIGHRESTRSIQISILAPTRHGAARATLTLASRKAQGDAPAWGCEAMARIFPATPCVQAIMTLEYVTTGI